MCDTTGKPGPARCGCTCSCPATMTVDEEIRLLEDHRKILQEQVAAIDTKIAALSGVKGS